MESKSERQVLASDFGNVPAVFIRGFIRVSWRGGRVFCLAVPGGYVFRRGLPVFGSVGFRLLAVSGVPLWLCPVSVLRLSRFFRRVPVGFPARGLSGFSSASGVGFFAALPSVFSARRAGLFAVGAGVLRCAFPGFRVGFSGFAFGFFGFCGGFRFGFLGPQAVRFSGRLAGFCRLAFGFSRCGVCVRRRVCLGFPGLAFGFPPPFGSPGFPAVWKASWSA